MNIRLISLATAAVLAVSTTACAGDVSPDELRDALVDQGLDAELVDCIVADLETKLSDDDFNAVAKADDNLDGVDPAVVEVVSATVATCATASTAGG